MMILIVVGARPNFMKIAPIVDVIKNYNRTKNEGQRAVDYLLLHTGQHCVLKNGIPIKKTPRYWDGKASERIFKVLKTIL